MIDTRISSILVAIIILSIGILGIAFGEKDRQQQQQQKVAYAGDLSDFNFAAAGDWGCVADTKKTVNNIVDKHPELVLALGDFSYESTADCWFKIISPIDEKMRIALGNHDNISSSILDQYMTHFNLTKQYYSFNYHTIHFVMMSTDLPFTVGSEQYNFVNADLAKAASDSKIHWIIVSYHHPAYTSRSVHSALVNLRNTYDPLFDKYGVDLILQGHNHNYQRSYPIKYNSTNPSNPTITDTNDDDNNYNNPSGRIFVTVGTGGIDLYSLYSKLLT
jgi:predicted phosphodiesterase